MIYLLPFISALIGWVTNYLAIKMLFYPRNEKDLFIFKLQGIFPKRKEMLAKKLGKLVSNRLFSMESLKRQIVSEKTSAEVSSAIEIEVDNYIRTTLRERTPFIARFINERVITQITSRVHQELEAIIPRMMDRIGEKLDSIDIEEMVYEKVRHFSNERIEELLMGVIKKELRFIELAGAVLGFAIGLIQLGLVYVDFL